MILEEAGLTSGEIFEIVDRDSQQVTASASVYGEGGSLP